MPTAMQTALYTKWQAFLILEKIAYIHLIYYRPHPKDGGRYRFQFVSSHLDEGGGGVYRLADRGQVRM